MANKQNALAAIDSRSFFEQALAYGVEHGILTSEHVGRIKSDGPKGVVQIANFFGTAYLHLSLEVAAARMDNLISLFLAEKSGSNPHIAAMSLRDNPLLSHSKGGSDMLKRLNALPVDTHLMKRPANPADEKAFLDERSFAFPMSLDDYRKESAERQQIQRMIDFARWAAGQLKARYEDYDDQTAEALIHSAMLVWCVGQAPVGFPTKAEFVKMVMAARKASFKPQLDQFHKVLKTAPEDFRAMAEAMMERFTRDKLPALRDKSIKPVEFIHGDHAGLFFIRESLDEDVGAFDELVAKEWVRITKGKTDDATLATIFLLIATGQPPKASLLQKDAKAIIARFRESGVESAAVKDFITTVAPMEQQEALLEMWREDLLPEAEIHLADPEQDDSHMERALKYVKENCAVSWKGRS